MALIYRTYALPTSYKIAAARISEMLSVPFALTGFGGVEARCAVERKLFDQGVTLSFDVEIYHLSDGPWMVILRPKIATWRYINSNVTVSFEASDDDVGDDDAPYYKLDSGTVTPAPLGEATRKRALLAAQTRLSRLDTSFMLWGEPFMECVIKAITPRESFFWFYGEPETASLIEKAEEAMKYFWPKTERLE